MVKLWHVAREGDPYGGARNSNKVVLALDELGERYELKTVLRLADVRPPDAPYRKLNPNGVVPTLEEDGLVLWESGAILRYLADSRPGRGLMPDDVRGRALAQQWLTWEGATLAPALIGYFLATLAEPRNEAAVEAARGAYLDKLGILDRQLAGRDYVAGAFSVADIALGSLTALSFGLGLDLGSYRHILAWLRRLRARPAFARNEMFAADLQAGAAQLA